MKKNLPKLRFTSLWLFLIYSTTILNAQQLSPKFEYVSLFKEKHYKMIMKLTNGNLRTINKLLYKLFEILEYYDLSNPSKINQSHLQLKFLEMAGISQGMIHA